MKETKSQTINSLTGEHIDLSNKLPNKEDGGEICCKKCGVPKSTWGTIPYPYPPCAHEVDTSHSDKTWEERFDEKFVSDKPDFPFARYWNQDDEETLYLKKHKDFIQSELTSATIKAREEKFRDGELNGRTQVINLTLGYLIKNGGDQERYAEYISEELEKLDNLEEPKS